MGITRRDFLKYCGLSAAALGLSSLDLVRLEQALANPDWSQSNLAARQRLHRLLHVLPKLYQHGHRR